MTKNIKLVAASRDIKKDKMTRLREKGFIPAVVYGSGTANENLQLRKLDFERVFASAGEFNLIDLTIDSKPSVKVIIKEVAKDAVKNDIIHADFYRVDMTKKITTEIPLNFIGESKAVKELNGTLVKNMDNIAVRCLPGDLISHIDIDLSVLVNIDDLIRLKDLKLPDGIELASDTNEAVIGVKLIKIEVEPVKPAEAVPAEGAATIEGEAKPEGGEVKDEKATEGKVKEEKVEKKGDKK